MLNLIHAEWTKVTGNRWVTGCMIWIFPLGAIIFMALAVLIFALSTSARTNFASQPHNWTTDMIGVWDIPTNIIGRLILVGFTAVMFAGEYQWGTWKNLIPRHKRIPLILTKFATLGLLIIVAFVLMSFIVVVGMKVLVIMTGGSYGPRLTGDVLTDFLGDYAFKASLAFTSTLIAASYAALAAILTRSIIGGVVVGFGVAFVESVLLIAGLALIAYFLDLPKILNVYRITPTYNLDNITSWINQGHARNFRVDFGENDVIVMSDSLFYSIEVLALWVFGLVGLTTYLFKKQDITS